MKLFDSHSHLTHPLFNGDREEIIKKLRDFDIKVLNIGNDLEDSKKAIELSKKYPSQMWASAGLHPDEAKKGAPDKDLFMKQVELAKTINKPLIIHARPNMSNEFVARKIAEWKGLNFDTAAKQTIENARKLFKINITNI